MKRSIHRPTRSHRFAPLGWVLLTGSLTLGATLAAAQEAPDAAKKEEPKKEEAKPDEPKKEDAAKETKGDAAPADLKNWFTVSVGGALTSGDKAAFKQRHQVSTDVFGGIEDFHYEQDVGKKGLFKVDGRGIFDNHDYLLKLDLSNPELGYVRAGYREFRTWYDGSGGYFPGPGGWVSLYDDQLALDRGEFSFETGLTLPKAPQISFGYRHQFREGEKDSTIWGLAAVAPGGRGIVPTFLGIDETRDIFTGDIKYKVGKTGLGLGVSYETGKIDDTRNLRQYPGGANDAHVTQRDGVDSSLFNIHAHTETRFNDKTLLTLGYAYTDMDNDFSGYRVYGTGYDPDLAQRLPGASSFENLMGGSLMSQHVANVNFMFHLADTLMLVPSVRIEKQDAEGLATYNQPALPASPNAYTASSDRGLLDLSQRLELRYTGITNVVLFARGDWLQGSGDLEETWDNVANQANVLSRTTDDKRNGQKYTVGANWYPVRRVSLGGEYYNKIRDNRYDHTVDSTSNGPNSFSRYPAFLTARDFNTDDVNFRVTWRPRSNLSLVGRYDFQLTTIDNQADQLAQVQSADITSHILSGSASWTPFTRLYLLGSLSYVYDVTDTPVDEITAAVQRGENNYWTASVGAGYALDNKTDLEAQYLYYRSDNYLPNYASGMPYGAGLEENGVTVGVSRQFSKRIRASLKYGFFTSSDDTSGNQRDYDAHLIYSTLQYRF